MIAQRAVGAAPVVRAMAEQLPLKDDAVDAALAVLSGPAGTLGLLQVDTGAECRVGAGQHHRPDRRVGVGAAQRRVERLEQRTVQRVSRFRSVEGQNADRAGIGSDDAVVGDG